MGLSQSSMFGNWLSAGNRQETEILHLEIGYKSPFLGSFPYKSKRDLLRLCDYVEIMTRIC